MSCARSLVWAALTTLIACSSRGEFHARPPVLASLDTKVEAALAFARQSALEGDYERAEDALRRLLDRHRNDAMVPLARLLLARIAIARGNVPEARRLAEGTDVSRDPALGLGRRLVLGVAAVLEGSPAEALPLLRPLVGRLIDRAETAELSCALAEAEARAGDPGRALQALALVETIAAEGGAWVYTGLECERPDARLALIEQTLTRTEQPQMLADTLDALPPESPLRRPLALRLRALAEALHETPRWLRWLVDLPDQSATAAPIVAPSGPATLVLGVLAPLSGEAAYEGVAIVRGVQFALEGIANVRTAVEDEGRSPAAAVAAFDRLVAQGARAVVGVSRAESSAAVAIRAQALGVDIWLLAPARGVEASGARVHLAGPPIEERIAEFARAARARGTHVTLVAPEDRSDWMLLSEALTAVGVDSVRVEPEALARRRAGRDEVFLVTGEYNREERAALSRVIERAPPAWLVDARSALPGAAGTWIGVRPGPALAALLPHFCRRNGEAPTEFELLGYDAARRAAAFARSQAPPECTLATGWPLATRLVPADAASAPPDAPAAAARCPASPSSAPR